MAGRKITTRLLRYINSPSFWAIIALVFVAFLLAWTYQLNRDTQELARENRHHLMQIRQQGQTLKAAVEHQCKTDAAHDVAVRQFIRTTKDLNALAALIGLHLLLVDVRTCKEVTG